MFSHHAAIMIFFFIMPTIIGGLANLYLPVILGVPEMVFPRLNAIGLWILPLAFGLLVLSSQLEDGMSSG